MEVEHAIKVFPLDTTLEKNVEQMGAEGWLMVPGVVPVGIYHVVKIKGLQPGQAAAAPKITMSIDETKVKILRNGQLIDG